jgi:hypothetical protein
VVYIHNGKSEILSFAAKWMKLEDISLGETSQTKKANTTCSLSYVKAKKSLS